MALEKGKNVPEPFTKQEGAISREAHSHDVEKNAAQSGDNDADRIITPPEEEAKKETDENFIKNQGGSKQEGKGMSS